MQGRRILVLAGAVLLIVGARLPWMSVPALFGVQGPAYEAIEIGWEDNGLVTGGIGVLILLGGLFLSGRRGIKLTLLGAGLAGLAILVVAGCAWRIIELRPEAGFFAASDVGLYLTLCGACLALAGSLGNLPGAIKDRRASHRPVNAAA